MNSDRAAGIIGAVVSLVLCAVSIQDYLADRDILPILYVGVHGITAWLFWARAPRLLRPAKPLPDLIAVLSLLSPYAYDASALDDAGPVNSIVLIAAAAFLLFSTASLGRSFGILPALRGIRTRYAYRLVRHPVYSSYLLMDAAILTADPGLRNVTVFIVAFSLLLARIHAEEQLLSTDPEYRVYKGRVRYRLIPFVF